MESTRIVESVKYYVSVDSTPVAAVKVYKTEDNKYHRYIAAIKQKPAYGEKEVTLPSGRKFTRKCLQSPKKMASEYLNKFGDAWVTNNFTSDIPQEFPGNIADLLHIAFRYNYGNNRRMIDFYPVRYQKDVILFNHEFRMFHKPEGK